MKATFLTALLSLSAVSTTAFTPSAPPFLTRTAATPRTTNSRLFYDSSRDPPHEPNQNAWQVLATTEAWISQTLASSAGPGGTNPYSRKEVSYACETLKESAMVVAGIFRRLKEARELGESHGVQEEDRAVELGDAYEPHTLRQTQVIVIPGNKEMTESFAMFDAMIEAINQARRNARDYVTDVALEKLDDRLAGDGEDPTDWSVSVNCAHLHPNFGEKTPEQALQEMKEEEEQGEVDVNYQEYKEKRMKARQSPFPTIVIEVRSSPPPDFGSAPSPPSNMAAMDNDSGKVSSGDIQKLEALFGQSAASKGKDDEDSFYDAIGDFITDVSSMTPLKMAQQWVAEHDADIHPSAAFTETNAAQVDAAYEFVFTNIAMLMEEDGAKRQYLVMPHFLSSAATSFEKFAAQVQTILDILPDLSKAISVSTLHPEHIDPTKRSPMPIFVLQKKGE